LIADVLYFVTDVTDIYMGTIALIIMCQLVEMCRQLTNFKSHFVAALHH